MPCLSTLFLTRRKLLPAATIIGLMSASGIVFSAEENPHSGVASFSMEKLKQGFRSYPERNHPNQVFFGDTHLHTAYSTDAGLVGNVLLPDAAYRFAKGEAVETSMGQRARLREPLDFLVVTDHAENLGLPVAIQESSPKLLANEWGEKIHDLVKQGTVNGITAAFDLWLKQMTDREDPLADQTELAKTMWQRITDAADRHNAPGLFTTMIGYEWTSAPKGSNLHRNVIFRDGSQKTNQIVPMSSYDSQDPQDLWQWLEDYETRTGGRVMAIPHNANISNGLMFDNVTLAGEPLDADYARTRMRWEPLYEVTQLKGDTEAHPMLSPNDEFADFETWDKSSFGAEPKTEEMIPAEYAREALKQGLAMESKLGANPFKFGLIGSTDSHTSMSSAAEDNYLGKVTLLEPSVIPPRMDEVITGRLAPEDAKTRAREIGAAGLAAVWARENTRESIWDAMARKEVYATTGTRLRVRVFGGWDFAPEDLVRSDFEANAYGRGVPMGGDLSKSPMAQSSSAKSPSLLILAMRAPEGANLDRVQVVKGWLGTDGKPREKVFDVAWSDPESRQVDSDGTVPAVGNTVDGKTASYTNSIGAPSLNSHWEDPDFDPSQRAFYYVRVLEIPTPRWTTFDAKHFGVTRPTDVPVSIQERAYTSPIWYTPDH